MYSIFLFLFYFVWLVLVVFPFKTLHLLGRNSTTWTIPCSGNFQDRVLLFCLSQLCPQSSNFMLPTVSHNDQLFFWLKGILQTFLFRLAWNHNPPDLSFLHRLGWQACTSIPNYWLRWDLVNFCPSWTSTTILLISASQVARIMGVNHWVFLSKTVNESWRCNIKLDTW
jgi:hypothetical protein